MAKKGKVYVSRQIAVYRTSDYLIEMIDSLKAADREYFPCRLHARGEKYFTNESEEEVKEKNSLIRLNMLDYNKKRGDGSSLNVYYNVEPEYIRWLQSRVVSNVCNFAESGEKIFGKNEDGTSTVTKIFVTRQDSYNGEKKRMPWTVTIENGHGIRSNNRSGGYFCKPGSYVKECGVTARFTDYDFYSFLTQCVSYIDSWEKWAYCESFFKIFLNQLYLAIKSIFAKTAHLGVSSANRQKSLAPEKEEELPYSA